MIPGRDERLDRVGPHVVVRDEEGSLLIRWPGVLPTRLGTFDLEFEACSIGLRGRCQPHGRMFEIWERWQARQAEFTGEFAATLALEAEALGVTPTAVSGACVVVTQIQDGPHSCYYGAKAWVQSGGIRVVGELDDATDQLILR